ncbi:complement receptor type 2-like isoform X1 [Erpetoichthys calabaricus]|uniref:complement receptor type 2-like isoform X1 n=1 Tax=Erpetoichthys calabaricus TaxID=27687 RepID=UPI002234A4D7|nr:complement receptor type 2-like isoform X1 [Erpetoichthys calabaricus]
MKTALCLFGTLVELVGFLGLVTGDCGIPPSVANAVPRSEFLGQTVFSDGSKPLFYECIPGNNRVRGTYGITCTGSSWSVPSLICERKNCGIPPELYNGEYEITEGTEFGATATAKCHEGYIIEGRDYHLTCGADGHWFGDSLVCDRVVCHILPEIKNGSHDSMGRVQYGSVVTYNCNPGFDMIGNHQITCESNGEYSSQPPKCIKVRCPNINIANGWKISGFNLPYAYKSSITFACDNGFQLNGPSFIVCDESGTWKPDPPTCVKTIELWCPNINIANGWKIFGFSPPYVYKNSITFACDNGFQLNGPNTIVCDESGTWKPDPPTCVKTIGVKCQDPPEIENGSHDPESGIFSGSVVSYKCNPGLDLIGSDQLVCGNNGEYNSQQPVCKQVSCPNINIENGAKTSGFGPQYRYKNSITFICISGFQLIGQSTIYCDENNTWKPNPPTCVKAIEDSCPNINIENGQKTSGFSPPYRYKSSITFTCNNGFQLNGQSTIYCDENNTWKPNPPTCVKAIGTVSPPTTTTTTTPRDDKTDKIVGGIVGGIILLALSIAGVAVVNKYIIKKNRSAKDNRVL